MNNIINTRLFFGLLLAPIVYILIWTIPLVEHTAFMKWLAWNTLFAYINFAILGYVAHLLLSKYNLSKLWQYIVVMFAVTFLVKFFLSVFFTSNYESLYYSRTQVVENGDILLSSYL